MKAATKKGSSECLTTGPDVCLYQPPGPAPPVPVPVPTQADEAKLKGVSKKVTVENKGAAQKGNEIPSEKNHPPPGPPCNVKGVVTHTCMKTMTLMKGSSKVKVEGKPWAHQAAPTKHNKGNMMGMGVKGSQDKVTVMP